MSVMFDFEIRFMAAFFSVFMRYFVFAFCASTAPIVGFMGGLG